MASRDTIMISSGEEDADVKITLVTKRRNRKRRKISDSTHTQAEPENKDEKSRDAALTVSGSSPVAKIPARARSADIPTSSFGTLPVPERSRSAPQDHKHAIHVPTSLQHGLPDRSFAKPDARPSTPIRQSSGHLSCPASSTPQQAYPTPKTISPSVRRQQFKDLMPNSYVASERGIPALGVGEKDATVVEGNRQHTPEVARAIGLEDPFGPATKTRVLNSGLGGTYQTSQKNGESIEEAPGHPSEVAVKPLPQAAFASSIQSAGGSDNTNTKDAVDITSGRFNPSERPKKRKLHSVEPTVPQPRIRNRILWSTPAFKEPNDDHSGPSPLNSTTELAENSNALGQSTSAVSQERGAQNIRRTWTCKMYADLAQQLQECFSFGDFAKKHSRSEHEVFDLFSAAVHLPLLQKSSTGLSRVSPQGHQRLKAYRSLFKETKTALAKEGKKEEKEPKRSIASLKSSAEDHGSRKAVVKTPSQDLPDTAMRSQNRVDAC